MSHCELMELMAVKLDSLQFGQLQQNPKLIQHLMVVEVALFHFLFHFSLVAYVGIFHASDSYKKEGDYLLKKNIAGISPRPIQTL